MTRSCTSQFIIAIWLSTSQFLVYSYDPLCCKDQWKFSLYFNAVFSSEHQIIHVIQTEKRKWIILLILQEEEVEKLDEMIASHEQQKSEKQGLLNDSQKEFDEAESKFKVVEQEMRSKAEGGEPLKDELGNTQVEIEQAKINKKHYEMKLKEQEKKIHDLRKKVDIYKAEIEVKKNILCSINMSILILNMYWNKSNANVWYQILE